MDQFEEKVFKPHFFAARYVGYTACFLFGCLVVVGSWFIPDIPWFALLYANIFGLIFMSSMLHVFWSVNKIVIGPGGITIARFRKEINIRNEIIDEIRTFDNLGIIYIKTNPKNALPLGERIHMFECTPYPFLFLPLKQELLSRYGKKGIRRKIGDKPSNGVK